MTQPEDIVSRIALVFSSDEDFDFQLDQSFALIGKGLDISRCYLFVDSPDRTKTRNTHEWCAPGIEPQIHNLQSIPDDEMNDWKVMIDSAEVSPIDDISTLPASIRSALEPQGIKSIIVAQLLVQDSVSGFIGFDECTRLRHWTAAEKKQSLLQSR